jgi:two-component system response regulator AtoC
MSQKTVARPDIKFHELHGILTVAPEMLELFERIQRVAQTEATVLIRGPSGAGKELVAKALHQLSPRDKGPFRALNCATLTEELLASELFGHVRGAFTGAVRDRKGLFALADGGTVFLDEIAELPLGLQARLLRVLQERSFIPVGGSRAQHVDVRVVSATNKGLRHQVEVGLFREDLMYRVRVVVLFLPPLVERSGDVEALTWHFIDRFNAKGWRRVTGISEEACEAICNYSWPGNIRELENNIQQAFALGEGPIIQLDELTPELQGEAPEAGDALRPRTALDLERDRLLAALDEAGGRKGKAAEVLGMSRSTLWRKLRFHRIT